MPCGSENCTVQSKLKLKSFKLADVLSFLCICYIFCAEDHSFTIGLTSRQKPYIYIYIYIYSSLVTMAIDGSYNELRGWTIACGTGYVFTCVCT